VFRWFIEISLFLVSLEILAILCCLLLFSHLTSQGMKTCLSHTVVFVVFGPSPLFLPILKFSETPFSSSPLFSVPESLHLFFPDFLVYGPLREWFYSTTPLSPIRLVPDQQWTTPLHKRLYRGPIFHNIRLLWSWLSTIIPPHQALGCSSSLLIVF